MEAGESPLPLRCIPVGLGPKSSTELEKFGWGMAVGEWGLGLRHRASIGMSSSSSSTRVSSCARPSI